MAIEARARKRRLLTLVLVATALVAGMALTPMAAKAVHNEGLFELDGNIADDSLAPGQDWSSFQGPVAVGDTAPVSTVFISDGFDGVDDSIYFGGGSQNNNDISSWRWSCGGVSTKSDIEHAFATAYIESDQLFLYFGGDRFDPTGGTTNIGFWFLQNGGALQGGSGCPDSNPATNTFSGQHEDGDLFVFAEFTGGGGDSGVSIFEWMNGGLHLLTAKSSGSFCSPDDSICARSNNQTIASTWPYVDNQGASSDGQILQGGFVEGGINLSSIYEGLGKELPCVNRFLAQTGSSHPDTGVLEDFAGGSFNVCSKLIVDKVTPSGDQTKFPFSVSGPGAYSDSFELAAADAPHDSGQIKSGTYTVTETPADSNVWNAPSVTCKDQGNSEVAYANGAVSIAPGATVTCTFTNSKKPQLTVIKKIVGGNGTTDSFDVQVDGTARIDDATSTNPAGTSSGAFAVSAGSHAVTETLGDGSTAVSASDWEISFSGDCDSSGQVSVQNDQSKTCTVTNSKLPRLQVVKQIEGGDGSSFDISVGVTKVLDDAGDGASDERTYAPGGYSVSETFGDGGAIGAGWTVVFSGDCDADGDVTLAYGDAKVCTVTNKRKPQLTVVKVIEGGNGAGFDLKVNGATVLDDVGGTGGQVSNTYPVGTDYSVTETRADGDPVDPAVWETSSSADCSGTLAAGDDKTCTITNKRKPQLTVVKVIEGGNGAGFDLAVNDSTVLDDVAGLGGQVTSTYPVDTDYAVSETLADGDPVDPVVWETTTSADCSGTLAAGDEKTCTITNKRRPRLTVVKQIVGGDGSSFDISVGETKVLDDAGDGASDERTYAPGSYAVTETFGDGGAIGAGWTVAYSGDCDAEGDVTVDYGDDKTCTVTNSKLPRLKVVKQIEGGDGSSFDISVGDTKVLDDAGDGFSDERTYAPGGYSVSETFGDGGAIGAGWTVVFSGDCDADGDVTLAYGDAKVCTVTNKRKPKLTVVKVIEGGNGAGFDLAVNDSIVLDDVAGTGGQATNTYPVDTDYAVSETLANGDPVDPAVWETTTSADCSGTLAAGDDKTCTITNKRKPQLTVVKVIEGGNGAGFDLAVNDSTVLDDVGGTGGQVTNTYAVDTDYAVSETLANGDAVDPGVWETSSSADCSGTLAAGDEKTCTITNRRKPKLTVVKQIVGGDGSSFDISVGQTKVLDDAGDGASDERTYAPGSYSVTETFGDGGAIGAGWTVAYSGDCDADGDVVLDYGDDKTCTVTNSKLPRLQVVKQIVGGDGSSFDISVGDTKVLDDAGDGSSDERTYAPGGYSVTETFGDGGAIGAGWTVVYSDDCDGDGDVTLAHGDAKVCTITNKLKPRLTVVKVIEGGNGAGFDLAVNGTIVLDDIAGTGGQVTNTYSVDTDYAVSETLANGDPVDPAVWETTTSADCSGSLAAGDDKTCTITNKRKPQLTVVKVIEGGNGAGFDLAVNGATVLDDVGGTGGQVTNTYSVDTDYAVSETLANGDPVDPAVWETSSSADCSGTLAAGDEKTCTITNRRKPQLTVVKVIEGGNGAGFDLKVNDSTVLDDVAGTGGQVTNTYPVDTDYGVTETLADGDPVDPAVWETSSSGDCSGTLAAGDDKTCTITNKRRPRLTVVKQIVGGDGSSFDISVGETKVLDDAGDGASDERTYAPGGYSVSETFGDGGAIGAGWTVVFSGDCDADGDVTLAYGDAKVCTVTNRRKPQLTVVKVIEGGNGAGFDLKVNDSIVLDDVGGTGGQVTNTYTVDTDYAVSETLANGDAVDPGVWETSSSGDCSGTLAAGDEKICTITNKRRPKLTVVKQIVGGDGSSFDISVGQTKVLDDAGDGASDERTYAPGSYSVTETFGDGGAIGAGWTVAYSGDCDAEGDVTVDYGDDKSCTVTNSKLPKLQVVKQIEGGDGSSFDISVGVSKVLDDAGDGSSDERTYAPGGYSVSETFGDGGAIGAGWTVVFSGDCDADGDVTLAYGDAKVCTVTNKRKPKLTVVKVIVGGNGAGFDLKVNGTTVLDDVAGTGGQVTSTYPVDTDYSVTETLADGDPVDPAIWETTTSPNCSGTLAAGDDKICTITNKRKPKLTVVKHILGGDGSSFDISVGQTKALDDASHGSTDTRTYAPGTYAVTETLGNGNAVPAGWSTSYSSACTEGSVTLDYGDSKTCTITNSKLPQLIVIKHVVGGAKSPSDFQMSVSGDGPNPSSFSGSAEGTVVTLAPGGYDVSEGEDSHYSASYSADCKDGSIAYGESKTCTITNTRKPSSITIEKVASPTSVPEPGGDVTFTFRVHNTSPADTVAIDALADSVYGNLFLRGNCDALQNKELAPDDGAAGGSDEATCSFTALVSGNAADSHHNVASVTGHDEDERTVTDDDVADVEVTDVAPSIDVTKTADPITVAEPGGTVEFTVDVKNTSVSTDPVTITSLVDDPDGAGPAQPIDLNGKGSCSVPQTIQPGGTYTCKFTRMITGNAGDVKVDVVTAVGHDDDGHDVSDHDDATVTITDVASSISVDKSATPNSVQEPGGDVVFTVVVKNTSAADAVTIDTVVDSIYGNLAAKGTCGTLIGKVLQPDDHAAGGADEATCAFTGPVTGSAGSTHTNVVTVTGHDDDKQPLTADDDATVTITPAPPVRSPLIDLYVTKNDLPDPVQLNGRLTYTIVVGNNGPDAATQVTLADALPAGTSFVSVSTTQGTCTGGALISCNLGTVASGSTVTITLVVTAQQSGLVTNTVTVVGKEPEANTANNQATATTLVPAPVVRKPAALVCDAFTATPKSLRVGKRATVVVHVSAGGKPVKGRKVIVKGAGILKSARTNARGVARIAVTPRRPGIVTITVPQKLTCGGKRIGVVGAFEPRFTG